MDSNTSITETYLAFRLEDEDYAINVSKVFSILEMSPITKVPKSPRYMKGIINLRGTVLPVIDLRAKFGLIEGTMTVDTSIIVISIALEKEEVMAGIMVDAVKEVFEFSEDDIIGIPSIGLNNNNGFISKMTIKDGRFIMVLDVNGVFSGVEIEDIREHAQNGGDKIEKCKHGRG